MLGFIKRLFSPNPHSVDSILKDYRKTVDALKTRHEEMTIERDRMEQEICEIANKKAQIELEGKRAQQAAFEIGKVLTVIDQAQ